MQEVVPHQVLNLALDLIRLDRLASIHPLLKAALLPNRRVNLRRHQNGPDQGPNAVHAEGLRRNQGRGRGAIHAAAL